METDPVDRAGGPDSPHHGDWIVLTWIDHSRGGGSGRPHWIAWPRQNCCEWIGFQQRVNDSAGTHRLGSPPTACPGTASAGANMPKGRIHFGVQWRLPLGEEYVLPRAVCKGRKFFLLRTTP